MEIKQMKVGLRKRMKLVWQAGRALVKSEEMRLRNSSTVSQKPLVAINMWVCRLIWLPGGLTADSSDCGSGIQSPE